jgi:hypothetical protein
MRVANGLYLDNTNHFHSVPLPNAPMYEVGGGMLSLSVQAAGQLVSGTLAILPLAEQPGWKTFLRNKGVAEASIELFGKVADVAAMAVTLVGMAPAALKIAQLVGFLKESKSVEQLAQEILTKLTVVQNMVSELQGSTVKVVLETSIAKVGALRDQVGTTHGFLIHHEVAERKAMRATMLAKVDELDTEVRAVLSSSRWELINQATQYNGSWGFMTNTEEVKLTNAPWWGSPRFVPRVQLADDGRSWVPAVYPPAFALRFDYRGALPLALQSIMSYITALTTAEPEFRSTMYGRPALLAFAGSVDVLMRKMRACILRSEYSAYHFGFAGHRDDIVSVDPDGIFGPAPAQLHFRQPHFYWQVGSIDLCAHTDGYFNELALALSRANGSQPLPTTSYKLGTLDFDWLPPAPDPVLVPDNSPRQPVPPNPPHWELRNAQECADAANRQSEQDYITTLQASGYFQLAQLHATLLHLGTDPEISETVSGHVRRSRRRLNTTDVQIVGISGPFCSPPETLAAGKRDEFECRSTVTLTLQQPDRVNPIPTRILLVALSAPAETDHAQLMSEVELHSDDGTATLIAARTFDWYWFRKACSASTTFWPSATYWRAGTARLTFSSCRCRNERPWPTPYRCQGPPSAPPSGTKSKGSRPATSSLAASNATRRWRRSPSATS